MTRLLQVWLGFRLYVMCNRLYDTVSHAMIRQIFWKSPLSISLFIAIAIDIIGMAVLFEKHKKAGFYMMCAANIWGFILAFCAGVPSVDVLWPIAITYMLMAKRWSEFS